MNKQSTRQDSDLKGVHVLPSDNAVTLQSSIAATGQWAASSRRLPVYLEGRVDAFPKETNCAEANLIDARVVPPSCYRRRKRLGWASS
ncbi:hypothetical protein BURKHO8Y_400010 [Burkholderia sp. 8Y]|nr:hypothetical protein BURKHO8Y_400010 [Burkholderia sp. 8Y]